jgi:outer membrane protein assembly factor BamB
MTKISILALLLTIVLTTGSAWAGDNWPQFRGPECNGHSDCVGLPLKWSEKENVVWKTPIHDHGWSSPVVWHDQIWLTTATADGHHMFAVAVDRADGKIIHDVKVFDTEKLDHIADCNSYASPTSAIEDGRVYVHYGTYGTACLDTASGRVLWTRRDLNCDHHEGPGASLLLWNDLLMFNVDGRDVQYVVALDKTTGKTVWKTNRSITFSGPDRNRYKSYCTPIVIEANGRRELFDPGAESAMGYDPATGKELWRIHHGGWSITPRPVFGQGLAFFITDYEKPGLWAVRLGGSGDVTDSHIVWKNTKGMPSRPSILLIDDKIYLVSSEGIAWCMAAQTGQPIWKQRMGGKYSASPIYADGRLYFFNENAVATVLQPGLQYKALATNKLDGEIMATPAVAGKAFFVRTRTHLYRIETRQQLPR